MSEADKPFVETVRIQNFGCARDVTLELTRLHALVGPNDSGKSTVLAAIRTACELTRLGQSALQAQGQLDPRSVTGSCIGMAWKAARAFYENVSGRWHVETRSPPNAGTSTFDLWNGYPGTMGPVSGATLVRWDPDAIRQPCELIAEEGLLIVGERGGGLPAIYDAILSRDRPAFDAIDASIKRHFPTVKGLWLPALSKSTKGLGVVLTDGTRVHANEMSEGLLYWLAFSALPHIEPPAILLIEEPENGLHPSRIAEVVKVLRDVSKRIQVIVATHSPLVINELQPSEVTILTRDDRTGTRSKRMDRTRHFQQRQQVYALGELWLSFADGVDEAALVNDSDPNSSTG